jgi:hypothetical protein
MRKLALLAGVGLLVIGSIDAAEAQRWNRDGGGFRQAGNWERGGNWGRRDWNRGYRYSYRYNTGGALAAGFVGGAVLGGLATAAAAPYYGYGYPYGYGYSYPSYGYGYGTTAYGGGYPVTSGAGYPVASYYGDDDYYGAPAYSTRVVYRQPSVRTRVVYRDVPTVRRTRVAYQQPRARIMSQPAYGTRVSYRQNQRVRVSHDNFRRDVISTGSIGNRHEMRMQRRMMQD